MINFIGLLVLAGSTQLFADARCGQVNQLSDTLPLFKITTERNRSNKSLPVKSVLLWDNGWTFLEKINSQVFESSTALILNELDQVILVDELTAKDQQKLFRLMNCQFRNHDLKFANELILNKNEFDKLVNKALPDGSTRVELEEEIQEGSNGENPATKKGPSGGVGIF
jgi:hypothetical protein